MIMDYIPAIAGKVSGQKARRTIQELMEFHRIPVSEDYRKAAVFCREKLEGEGISAKILSFPSNEKTTYWTSHMYREWSIKSAWLELESPYEERLCDFAVNCNSVISRSCAADYREGGLEIVLLDHGPDEKNYDLESLDLRGKLVLIDGHPRNYYSWAVLKCGAAGMIAETMSNMDGFRTRAEMAEARQHLSFSWSREETDSYIFGFVLNNVQADRLRALCRKMQADYQEGKSKKQYPTAKAYVDAKLYDGTLNNVTAVIEGTDLKEEEIMVVSHLCHPKTSANDNASGVAGNMELMRVLNELIDEGVLERPRRSIRMMLMPEFTGTYAWLAGKTEEDLDRIKAGINMDMIGGSQKYNGCTTVITDTPDAAPSFVQDVAGVILNEVQKSTSMAEKGDIPRYKYKLHDFVPQSDHFIYSDPDVGAPMLMMLQWPDKNYHTSYDTIEKIDPDLLGKNITIAAAYIYTMANLKKEDIPFIFNQLNTRLADKMKGRNLEHGAGTGEELAREKEYYRRVYRKRAGDLLRFFPECREEIETMLEPEYRIQEHIIDSAFYFRTALDGEAKEGDPKYERIPVKKFLGPVSPFNFYTRVSPEHRSCLNGIMKKYGPLMEACDFITYWTDGKNTIGEITEYMGYETGIRNPEFVSEYLELLEKTGLIEFKESRD